MKLEPKLYEGDPRSLAEVVVEIKDELKEFLQTRLQLLVSELHENLRDSKAAAIYAAVALVLLGTAYLLLVAALVSLLAVAFWGSPYAWFLACILVGASWAVFGGIFAVAAKNDFRGLLPKKTIEVIKEDEKLLRDAA